MTRPWSHFVVVYPHLLTPPMAKGKPPGILPHKYTHTTASLALYFGLNHCGETLLLPYLSVILHSLSPLANAFYF